MKKLFLLFALSLIVFSCNKDEITVEQENILISDSIDPKTTPLADFDESSFGMYHGVIATEDATFHGEIWINVGNDGNYNATVITVSGDKVTFFAEESTDATYTFKGNRGTFDYDVTDFTNAIATNVAIDSKVGVIHSYKEKSNQRGRAILGTYVDAADAAFTGTWDLISAGAPHPLGIGVVVDEIMVVAPGAGVFSDLTHELFDMPCFGVVGTLPMLLNDVGVRNELWAYEQTSTFGSFVATYDLGISSVIRDGNNLGYDQFFNRSADGTTPGCFLAGSSGVWSWNGRTGTVNFMSNVPLPTLVCAEIYEDTLAGFGDYRNDEDVIRTFSTGDASPLTMFFSAFDTEACCDFLHIYDGATTASPEIAGSPFSGVTLAGMEITGTGDTLTFEFISDGSVTAAGWLAEVCGTAAMPFVCTGVTTSFAATILDGTIPDGACPTETIFPVTATFLGPDVIGTDVAIDNVTIDISHTWDGDLEIHLVSPTGTFLDLSIGNGGGGDNYTATEFRDGGSSIVAGVVPFTGVFQPQGGTFAAAFLGEAASGAWSIQLCDNTAADAGIVNSFSITFCDAPVAPGAFRDFAVPYTEKLDKATFTNTRSTKVKSNVTEKEFVSKRVNPVSLNKN